MPSIPATLLDAVTGTGAGDSYSGSEIMSHGSSHKGIANNFSVVIAYAGAAPTAATIVLQGSHDDTTWVDLGNTIDVSATSIGFAAANSPFAFVRGNMTAYTAGSCTGVTVTCIGTN